MRRNRVLGIMISLALMAGLAGCVEQTAEDETRKTLEIKDETQKVATAEKETRKATTVEKRIVILSPPVYSIGLASNYPQKGIVGCSSGCFSNADPLILERVSPNYKEIPADFVNQDASVNIESLLKLKPEVIFYGGSFQINGLKDLGLPLVKSEHFGSPKDFTIDWERIFSEYSGTENMKVMQSQWKRTEDFLMGIKEKHPEMEAIRCLYIMSYVKGQTRIYTLGGTGDEYLKIVGLQNVGGQAEQNIGRKGQAQVSIEQVIDWDPEVIFASAPAVTTILQNRLPNQDWANIKAVQQNKVFAIPKGVYNWTVPSAESPLMPYWMVSKLVPDTFSEEDMRAELARYYQEVYRTELTDDEMDRILHPLKKEG